MIGRDKKTAEEQAKPMTKIERESADAAISLIAPGMNIVGDCETDGTIRVEGRVEGTIRAGKSVVVGRSGEVAASAATSPPTVGSSSNRPATSRASCAAAVSNSTRAPASTARSTWRRGEPPES
jgi:hypothetical protein